MKILNCFGLYVYRYTLASKRSFDKYATSHQSTGINSVLMYEIEDKWESRFENVLFQPLKNYSDGATGKQYVLCGFMVEKLWEKFSSFTSTLKISLWRGKPDLTPFIQEQLPILVFRDIIYAPLGWILINGGIKLNCKNYAKTIFKIIKMDCPSEEQLIRMKKFDEINHWVWHSKPKIDSSSYCGKANLYFRLWKL